MFLIHLQLMFSFTINPLNFLKRKCAILYLISPYTYSGPNFH